MLSARRTMAIGLALMALSSAPGAQEGARREITVTIRDASFEPARIEVRQNELVQVTFVSESEPHAFTLDAYRVAKRATPGHSSTFEFRADRIGNFAFYCALTSANGRAHEERGELIVRK